MKRSPIALAATLAVLGLGTVSAEARFSDTNELLRGSEYDAATSAPARERAGPVSRATRQAEAAERSARQRAGGASLPSLTGGGYQSGIASYYWQPQRVASGGRFNPNAMTAAHKTLPFGTRVRVTSVSTGRSVSVTINDRGPYVAGRVIDLSRAAASSLGMTGAGLARVKLDVIGR